MDPGYHLIAKPRRRFLLDMIDSLERKREFRGDGPAVCIADETKESSACDWQNFSSRCGACFMQVLHSTDECTVLYCRSRSVWLLCGYHLGFRFL